MSNTTPWQVWLDRMSEAKWSSDEAREAALGPLRGLDKPDDGWVARLAALTIGEMLPPLLRAAAPKVRPEHREALLVAADRCERELTYAAARAAEGAAARAAEGAAWAADAAAAASASASASSSAAWAAVAARDAAKASGTGDEYLLLGVRLAVRARLGPREEVPSAR